MQKSNQYDGKEKRLTLSNLCASFSLCIFVLTFAIVLTLFFRPIYHLYIDATKLPMQLDMEREEIVENYDVLIDYNVVFHREPLDFPSLKSSESGRIHFADVKKIFDACQIAMLGSFLVALIFFTVKIRRGERYFLRLAGGLSLALPIGLAIVFLVIGWDRVFVLFHKIMFSNDYWMFDANTDPVIRILPDGFFLLCAIIIVALIFLMAILLIFFSRKKN
ncbi:MAG: TIGR01906 family membrane protein [Clostridiales Family XIII bacterium]|nr:TIGR01906 family membrane protein [Clostridiales Family XIII bacterium]